MNGQIKFLVIFIVICVAAVFLQEKLHFLGISVTDNKERDNVNLETEGKEGESSKDEVLNYVQIVIGDGKNVKVNVEVADSDAERTLGLSNRKYLGAYDGMLFVFDESVNNSFWMKDTLIPLDIIFIDSDKYIVDIKDNNAPCTEEYCPMIHSSEKYKYVLEVNANFSEENDIRIGNGVSIHLDSSI